MLASKVIPVLALFFSFCVRSEVEKLKKELGMKSWFRDGWG